MIAAAFATFVALLSHVAGGGELPGAWGVAVPLTLSILVSVFLSGRRLRLWRLGSSVAVSQFLFHALFVLGTTTAIAPGPAVLGGHAGHGAQSLAGLGYAASAPAHVHLGHSDTWMWLAHAGAALLTIAMLHRGETVLTGLARFAGLAIARVAPAFTAPALPTRLPAPAAATQWFAKALTPLGFFPTTALLRGPPAGACSPA